MNTPETSRQIEKTEIWTELDYLRRMIEKHEEQIRLLKTQAGHQEHRGYFPKG